MRPPTKEEANAEFGLSAIGLLLSLSCFFVRFWPFQMFGLVILLATS